MPDSVKTLGGQAALLRRQRCRECLQPALQQIVSAAEQSGWNNHDIQLAIIEIAVEGLQFAKTDLATMLELKRIAWRAEVRMAV